MADASSGPRFGRYRLRGRVAMGGMGEVYKAAALGFDGVEKVVAIKLIRGSLASEPDLVKMFVEEAKVTFLLSHANVVQTFDVGTIDGQYFIAMEYVEGRTLGRLLKSCRNALGQLLPQRHAVYVMVEALKGLSHAHRARDAQGRPLGIVHRDVSPSNILVSHEGEVKVSDFGIAWSTMKSHKSELGAIKGKVPYMPPEQVRGGALDARADVYAVGAVLYEALTGRPPFVGPAGALIPLVVEGKFPRPRELNPDIPEELEAIVLKAMASWSEERFASAAAMRDALEELALRRAWRLSSTDLAAFAEAIDAEPRVEQTPPSDAFDIKPGEELCKVDAPEADGVSVFTSALASPSHPPRVSAPASPEGDTVDTTPDVPIVRPSTLSGAGGAPPAAPAPSEARRSAPPPTRASKPPTVPLAQVPSAPTSPGDTPVLPMRRRGRVVALYGMSALVVAVAAALAARSGEDPAPISRTGPERPVASGLGSPVAPPPPHPAPAPPIDPVPPQLPVEPADPVLPVGEPVPDGGPASAPATTLTINTEPWTRVVIDGAPAGTTPVLGRRVRPGHHQIVLTNPSRGINRVVPVTLREGERRRIVLDLTAGNAP